MVLKHQGVPEFDPPENYDPIELRGDHIILFKVKLPEDQTEETREILRQMLQNEKENRSKYYAN